MGCDDPPSTLCYVLGLYIEAPRDGGSYMWEDRLEFSLTDEGVAEMVAEVDGLEQE